MTVIDMSELDEKYFVVLNWLGERLEGEFNIRIGYIEFEKETDALLFRIRFGLMK